MTAALTFTGTVTKRLARTLTAALTFLGNLTAISGSSTIIGGRAPVFASIRNLMGRGSANTAAPSGDLSNDSPSGNVGASMPQGGAESPNPKGDIS
jgi:hypothetical protein